MPAKLKVYPGDEAAERATFGCCLLNPQAIETVFAHVTPSDYITPMHQAIAEAIHTLWSKGAPVDTVTVASWLVGQGHADDHRAIGTYLMQVQGEVPSIQRAGAYAMIVADAGRRRRTIMQLVDATEELWNPTIPVEAILQGLYQVTGAETPPEHDWQAISLTGELPEQAEPTMLARTDGKCLLYPGRVHAIVGEPESGKSMLDAYAIARITADGDIATVFDFEGQASDWQTRISAMAVPGADLSLVRYVRPTGPVLNPSVVTRLCVGARAAFFDGMTDAYALHGLDSYDNRDIARFLTWLVGRATAAGSAVVLNDHVVKNRDDRGRWAIGGQHKLAGIDVQYMLDVTQPFGIGREGHARITVNKDRPGSVRGFAEGGKSIGTFIVNSYPDGGMVAKIEPPRTSTDDSGATTFRPTAIMAKVSMFLASSSDVTFTSNALRAAIKGNNAARELALDLLVGEGFVKRIQKNGAKTYQHARPFVPPAPPSHPH